ncbi:MAG: sulfite exporter TauE/SafE family protein [Rhodospirillales bacterium]
MDLDYGWLAALAAALLATGGLAGVLAGLLGVGGGIVIVPVLFHLFSLLGIDPAVQMHLAVGTSLATIVPTSIVSARAHHRRDAVDFALLRSWGPAVFVGVLVGTAVGGLVNGEVLTGVFAVVALAVAANMAFRPEGSVVADRLPGGGWPHAIGGIVGAVSAMMGIGGGTLSVPILSAFSYPIRRAVGTAAAIGLIIAVPGAVGFVVAGLDVPARPPASLGYVNLIGFAVIVPATILAAPFGARIAHAINPNALRKAFALFLFLTALRMFARLFG